MSAKLYADVEKFWQDPDKSPFSLGPFTGLCLARVLKEYPCYIQHMREYLNYLKYEYERTLLKINSIRGGGVRCEISCSQHQFPEMQKMFREFNAEDHTSCFTVLDTKMFYVENIQNFIRIIVTSITTLKGFI